jgi:hypothetical protein
MTTNKRNSVEIQGDSVARGPKLMSINSLGSLATDSPCIMIFLNIYLFSTYHSLDDTFEDEA